MQGLEACHEEEAKEELSLAPSLHVPNQGLTEVMFAPGMTLRNSFKRSCIRTILPTEQLLGHIQGSWCDPFVGEVAQIVKNLPAIGETRVQSLGWEDHLEKEWLCALIISSGESHEQWSLAGCSAWGDKESDKTEQLTPLGEVLVLCDKQQLGREQDWWKGKNYSSPYPLNFKKR